MPELPEVETVRRTLEPRLLERQIVEVTVFETRLRGPVDASALRRTLVGSRVTGIARRAKYLVIHVSSNHALLVHLGMSGHLGLASGQHPIQPHDHVVLGLDDGSHLRFNDPRRFGLVEVCPNGDLANHPRLRHLGHEPLEQDFGAEVLLRQTRGSRRPIKSFLMDGTKIAGVGNIYACEALFAARIHPQARAGRLSAVRCGRLVDAVRGVLTAAIEAGGTTLKDFHNADGDAGLFQDRLRVYGREGLKCPRCASPIRRTVHSGRSTFFCGGCQRI